MRWFSAFLAMSICIALVGCGTTQPQQTASIWQMSQDDYQEDKELQQDQLAQLQAVKDSVDRIAQRLDDQQQLPTSFAQDASSKNDTRVVFEDQTASESDLNWGYQTVSLQSEASGDLRDYLDDKFAALEAKIESSCQCNPPVMSAQAPSTSLPELFEPPEITPSVSDRIISSRVVSVGQPVITSVSQPVTTYSSPVYSSSPMMFNNGSSGYTSSANGMSFSCSNGVCRQVQRPNGYSRSRVRIRR